MPPPACAPMMAAAHSMMPDVKSAIVSTSTLGNTSVCGSAVKRGFFFGGPAGRSTGARIGSARAASVSVPSGGDGGGV
eukprot:5411986-Prymnesium_polylepis.1